MQSSKEMNQPSNPRGSWLVREGLVPVILSRSALSQAPLPVSVISYPFLFFEFGAATTILWRLRVCVCVLGEAIFRRLLF